MVPVTRCKALGALANGQTLISSILEYMPAIQRPWAYPVWLSPLGYACKKYLLTFVSEILKLRPVWKFAGTGVRWETLWYSAKT
jgi:hypothetical protein